MFSLFKGAGYCLKGYQWLWKKELRRYVLPPLLINFVFMGLLLWLGSFWLGSIMEWVQSWLPSWLLWLQWPFVGLYFMGLIWTGFLLLSVLIHWVAAPFNDALSQKVEELMLGERVLIAENESSLVRQVTSSVKESVERLVYTFKWLLIIGLVVFVLSFIPLINILAPWLMVALGGWLLALEYFDYPLARRGCDFVAQRQLLAEQRASVIGFGTVVGLMLAVPLINMLVIPAAVIGSTLFSCDKQLGVNHDE